MSNFQINREEWAKLNIYEQLGNIGAEVGRAIGARRSGKEKRVQGAIDRALDLFAATTELLIRYRSYRLKEVLRARDEFLRLFYDDTFAVDADKIERYFMQFALYSRKLKDNNVVPSQRDYENRQENLYIRSSSANVARLNAAIASLESEQGQVHNINI